MKQKADLTLTDACLPEVLVVLDKLKGGDWRDLLFRLEPPTRHEVLLKLSEQIRENGGDVISQADRIRAFAERQLDARSAGVGG